jgi:DNA modification methylase
MHPTIKPVRLIEEALLDCSRRKDIVLDPFLGSGSTLIACEKTQRRCVGIEYAPRYVDATLFRWAAMTGREPIHTQTGETYSQRQATLAKEKAHGQ